MKHTVSPEPGVLPLFRLFAVLLLGLFLLGGGVLLVLEAFSHQVLVFYLAGGANALLLLGYLLLPQLQRLLGNKYLYIGVIISSVGPIVINHLTQFLEIQPVESATAAEAWPLAAILFVPLVILAWQYPLRAVVVFCIGTGILDLLLALPLAWADGLHYYSATHAILARTGCFFLVGLMINRIMTIQRAQRESLAKANVKLTHYAATLEQLATTRERNRLARELHDTLAHTLSALAVELEAVESLWEPDPAQARTLLRRSLGATRDGLTETRRALQALRASPLEDLGPALAIRQKAETTAARANVALDLHIPDRLDDLPPDVEQCIYRVAQEALANVAQHAGAQRASVELLHQDGTLTLTISDDGRGFDPENVDSQNHLGLQGMRERAEMAGGRLEIESEPEKGTTIRLTIASDRTRNNTEKHG